MKWRIVVSKSIFTENVKGRARHAWNGERDVGIRGRFAVKLTVSSVELVIVRSRYFASVSVFAIGFWPTVLSVAPLVHCVVCLSVCLCVAKRYVLAKKCLTEWIGNQGQKVDFCVAAIFLLPVSLLRPPRRPFLPYFCPYGPAIGTRWTF